MVADLPTEPPTEIPTEISTDIPTEQPTDQPTEQPTEQSTEIPADQPADKPADKPEIVPNPPANLSAAVASMSVVGAGTAVAVLQWWTSRRPKKVMDGYFENDDENKVALEIKDTHTRPNEDAYAGNT